MGERKRFGDLVIQLCFVDPTAEGRYAKGMAERLAGALTLPDMDLRKFALRQ